MLFLWQHFFSLLCDDDARQLKRSANSTTCVARAGRSHAALTATGLPSSGGMGQDAWTSMDLGIVVHAQIDIYSESCKCILDVVDFLGCPLDVARTIQKLPRDTW